MCLSTYLSIYLSVWPTITTVLRVARTREGLRGGDLEEPERAPFVARAWPDLARHHRIAKESIYTDCAVQKTS